MKRRIVGLALLGAAVWLTASSALGDHGGHGPAPHVAAYGPGIGGGCGHPCGGYNVSYVDQKVTCYRTEYETRDVPVKVCQWVPTQEQYTYTVNEPETRKQQVTVTQMQTKQEPYTYKVCEYVPTQEQYTYTVNEAFVTQQKVRVPQMQTKQEPYTYKVCEYVPTQEQYTYTVNEAFVTKQKVKVQQV
jgi:hypothetical protein